MSSDLDKKLLPAESKLAQAEVILDVQKKSPKYLREQPVTAESREQVMSLVQMLAEEMGGGIVD